MKKITLSDVAKRVFANIASLDKEVAGLVEQLAQHRKAFTEIKNLKLFYITNKSKRMSVILGNNLIREMTNKETVDALKSRMSQVETALDSIEEQKTHREDQLVEEYLKMYDYLTNTIPPEMIGEKDADNKSGQEKTPT